MYGDMDGNLRYLKSMSNPVSCSDGFRDDLWVPNSAVSLLKNLQKESVTLTDTVIEYILHELNKLWRERENKIKEKAFIFCKNCKNKTLMRNHDQSKYLPSE